MRCKQILYLLLNCFIASTAAAAGVDAQKFFRLGNRDFTLAEARKIAGTHHDLRSAIQANFAVAAAIVLCEQQQIELSSARTRQSLQESLLLMPSASRAEFLDQLREKNLTQEQWLDQESGKLRNMLNEAIRRWYVKVYGSSSEITRKHINNWYFRHQNIFRRIKLDPDQILAFNAQDEDKFIQALAALRQGMSFAAVRRQWALTLSEAAMDQAFHEPDTSRTLLDDDFVALKTAKYRFLLKKSAIKKIFLPLDEKLSQAIGNALYDALAKARLAETLKKEFADQTITFY